MSNYIDLHTHSTASDGIYSPTDLLQRAHEVGLRVLALTDHDSTAGLDGASETALHLAIDFIPGIEINTDVGKDEIHVLGYYLEYQRPEFQATLQVLRDARVRRGQRMVELLNEEGIHITWERVRQIAQGTVGRPHVARAARSHVGIPWTGGDARRSNVIFFCFSALLHQLKSLQDAKAVLLVNNHEAELGELDFLLDQGMRSDYKLCAALSDVAADLALAVIFE